jgi:hypothetical protein
MTPKAKEWGNAAVRMIVGAPGMRLLLSPSPKSSANNIRGRTKGWVYNYTFTGTNFKKYLRMTIVKHKHPAHAES